MEIYSIGFTKKSAHQFFGALRQAGVRRLVDVRLNNVSQLSGFAKRQDLPYFLKELCGADYLHEPLLAPTQTMLDDYKKRKRRLGSIRSALPGAAGGTGNRTRPGPLSI